MSNTITNKIDFKISAILVVALFLFSGSLTAFAHEDGETEGAEANCPVYAPPAPGWCEGGVITAGKTDDNGCVGRPVCSLENIVNEDEDEDFEDETEQENEDEDEHEDEDEEERGRHNSSSSSDLREKFQLIKANFVNNSGAQNEVREEVRAKLAERRVEIVNRFSEKFSERLESFLERNGILLEKLEERIELIEERRDIELTEARDALDNAWIVLAEAENDMADLDGIIDDVLDNYSDGDKNILISVLREVTTEAKDSVKSAHKATVEVITAVKASLEPFVDRPDSGDESEDDETPEDE